MKLADQFFLYVSVLIFLLIAVGIALSFVL
jgi:hypothetical protein